MQNLAVEAIAARSDRTVLPESQAARGRYNQQRYRTAVLLTRSVHPALHPDTCPTGRPVQRRPAALPGLHPDRIPWSGACSGG